MTVLGIGANSSVVAALLLCALAVSVLPARHRRRSADSRSVDRPATAAARRAVLWALAVGATTAVLLPDQWWAALGGAVVTGWLVRLQPAGRSSARSARNRRQVAVCTDLLAACLDAGMAVGPALRAACEAMNGPVVPAGGKVDGGPSAVLDVVAVMLTLGADADTAWRVADLDEDLAPLAAAARRSASGGGTLADAAREHAAQLRQDDAAAAVRAAGRAGVLMTAPLGVCFLPAFLCLGLAPVVLGLLGQLSIF